MENTGFISGLEGRKVKFKGYLPYSEVDEPKDSELIVITVLSSFIDTGGSAILLGVEEDGQLHTIDVDYCVMVK